jgi:hypothetical protein
MPEKSRFQILLEPFGRELAASDIGLTLNSTAVIRTLPVVSAFVVSGVCPKQSRTFKVNAVLSGKERAGEDRDIGLQYNSR